MDTPQISETWPIHERPGWQAVELDNGDVYATRRNTCPARTYTHRLFEDVLADIDSIEQGVLRPYYSADTGRCECGAPIPCTAPRFGGRHVPPEIWLAGLE
jgi:hypothetical protein